MRNIQSDQHVAVLGRSTHFLGRLRIDILDFGRDVSWEVRSIDPVRSVDGGSGGVLILTPWESKWLKTKHVSSCQDRQEKMKVLSIILSRFSCS